MLINVLTPYLNVEIIASGTRTYGKPVGFFGQSIYYNNVLKMTYWPASFVLKNSRGNLGEKYNKGTESSLRDYWDGLIPDKTDVNDYIFVDVGDRNETMLATALSDAVPTISTKAALQRSVSQPVGKSLREATINTPPKRDMIKERSK